MYEGTHSLGFVIFQDGEFLEYGERGYHEGSKNVCEYHHECLGEIIEQKHPDLKRWKNEVFRDRLCDAFTIFGGDVVFCDTSKQSQKQGVLYLPQDLTSHQVKELWAMKSVLDDFDQIEVGIPVIGTHPVYQVKDILNEKPDFLNIYDFYQWLEDYEVLKRR